MRYALPVVHRYKLAEAISFFLVEKNRNIWDTWTGHLSKAEQLEAFGLYMGKGMIEVNGEFDYVAMTKRVGFGGDIEDVYFVSAQTGWLSHDGNRHTPILELNLYSTLDHFNEVAA